MEASEEVISAANTVLTACLALPPGSDIVIIADETTRPTVDAFMAAAVQLELCPTLVYYSIQTQLALQTQGLKAHHSALLDPAVAVLICLSGSPACLPFRDHVRQAALNASCKVAHMPGITPETLILANVDYATITARCELLALALAKGQQLEIVTQDSLGNQHRLRVPLDPWRRLPMVSNSIIQRGSWGNIPPGETYIAPPEGQAHGSIVINGSLPGYVLATNEELILHFDKGRLVRWSPTSSPAAIHLLNTQIEPARKAGDPNWSNLAEIGLGVNDRIQQLTGRPLLDEKKYGSLHIAIGDSTDMGGKVKAQIHCDMVVLSPTVMIDDKVIITQGKIIIAPEDWYEDHRQLQAPSWWLPTLPVICTAIDGQIDDRLHLYRLWDTSAGKVCSVQVGLDHTSAAAGKIYRILRDRGQPTRIGDLIAQAPAADPAQLLQLTYLLQQYALIKVYPNGV